MKNTYVYPAIFEKEEKGFSVVFPDLGIATSGENLAEAIYMARDALSLMLYDMEESGDTIPQASEIEAVSVSGDQFVSLVDCNTIRRNAMPTDKEMKEARKAIAYDLLQILEEKPEQETYTVEEIKKLIKVYVSTANQD